MRTRLPLGVVLALALASCSDPDPTPTPPNPSVGGNTSGGTAGSGGGGGSSTGGGGDTGLAGGGVGGSGGSAGLGGSGGTGGSVAEDPMPTLLSKTGLYADMATKVLGPGVHEYFPTYALWSDGAEKKRWVYMPEGGKIQTDANARGMDFWVYPKGFKLWKEFARDGKVIETRLLQKIADGASPNAWYMIAYKWNDEHTEATALVDGELNAMQTQHDIPSQKACGDCHGTMFDVVLGFSAMQLSHEDPTGMNLAKAVQLGWFNVPPPAEGYKLPGTPVEQQALGYLHANCGMCHNQFSRLFTAKTSMDLWARYDQLGTVQTTAAYLSLVCDQWPSAKTLNAVPIASCGDGHATGAPMDIADISKAKRVVPKDPTNSGIHDLMSLRIAGMADPIQMPPLATEIKDPTGLKAIEDWINGLP